MSETQRRPTTHAKQEAGRHLVAAEALLRGFSAEIQTAGRLGWVLINGRHVEVHTTTSEWSLNGPLVKPEADAVVFVRRSTDGRPHEYFVATRADALAALEADMAEYLSRHGGRRPRTPESDQQTLHRSIAEPWRDRRDVLSVP